MAALEVIALDEATPQLRAPASGDTYAVPRDMTFADLVAFGWGDAPLSRGAAGRIDQRSGTTAQGKRIYGTYTDASNGRWLEITSTTGGAFTLNPTGNGTGASNNTLAIGGVLFCSLGGNGFFAGTSAASTNTRFAGGNLNSIYMGSGALHISSVGTVAIGKVSDTATGIIVNGTSGLLTAQNNFNLVGYQEGVEMTAPSAPSANGYRLFAQDNGAGKTQLMVIFASGAAQQVAIEP